jgi:hypothetical protein
MNHDVAAESVTSISSAGGLDDRGTSVLPIQACVVAPKFPGTLMLNRLVDIFFDRHHEVEFCSFLHKASFDPEVLCRRPPFLMTSIITLTALYIEENEVRKDFGFDSPAAFSDYYAQFARCYARNLADEPSGKQNGSAF